jgi:hypothetical protein
VGAGTSRIDTQEALEELFERVRRMFFPRWRGGKNWSVTLGVAPGRPGLRGWCDLEERTIWMKPQWRGDEIVGAALIHEIVHAIVGRPGHGIRFQRRLLKAAELAEERGDADSAAALREDAESWAVAAPVPPSDVYRLIRIDAYKFTQYEALLDQVAEYYNMLPDEVERYYPEARQVYDEQRRYELANK